ncbi:hypothetical protein FACS189492_1260 [Clostridia bacterium]|nr:hypothetical protein FACS189492_1260 [Clostridia bacterium]
MTRKALIIGNPGEIGAENYCNGVLKDVENFKTYLQTARGGAWYVSEISTLMKPSKATLSNSLQTLNATDYTFIAFCGHGYSWREETMLELSKDNEINANDLKLGAVKRTIILDSCRKEEYRLDAILESRAIEKSYFAHNAFDSSRRDFDNAVSRSANGIVLINSCAYNETATDLDKYGGLYCYNYIKYAAEYNLPSAEYLTVVGVHNATSEIVRKNSAGNQNPAIEKPRTEPYFPFAV